MDFRREGPRKGQFLDGVGIQKDGFETGLVYKTIDVDGSGLQKDGFQTGVVYKKMDFRREWYTTGQVSDVSGVQNDGFRWDQWTKG